MTPEQMDQLRAFASKRIAENLRRVKLSLGYGVKTMSSHENEQVLFLEKAGPNRIEEEVAPWTVAIYGYNVSVSQGNLQYPPPADPVSWNNVVTSEDGLLVSANARGITNNILVNLVAYNLAPEPPTTGFQQFSQTLFLRIPTYQFPVRLRLQVTDQPTYGEESISFDNLDFTSGNERQYEIQKSEDGRKLVTAVSLTRL